MKVKTLLCGGLAFVRRGRGIRRPEMAPTPLADPELVGRPGLARGRVAKLHLVAAALAADTDVDVGHGQDSSTIEGHRGSDKVALRSRSLY